MLFFSNQEMYRFAAKHVIANHPKWCKICSYGIYIPWVDSACKDFFWELRRQKIPTYIIVGKTKSNLPKYCKDVCEKYDNVEIKVVNEMHAKCMLFSDRVFITGSVNISDSDYAEIAMSTKLTNEEMGKVLSFMTNLI